MSYDPTKDFVGLWRLIAGQVVKAEMPGLDFVVAALARAGLITLAVSATAPVVAQSTTAWLQAAVPSNSAEGVMRLWDPVGGVYVAATPALLFKMLQTAANQNGVSWWFSAGGPPANVVGNNGDLAIRTDEPGGIFGPKVAGAWPVTPIPGTTDVISSTQLDLSFGTAEGSLIYRGPAVWQTLAVGANHSLITSSGVDPQWQTLNALMDNLFGSAQGSIMYRDAGAWFGLPPGSTTNVLQTNGPGLNPSWAARSTEFPSGTVMLFQQTAAPPGWVKQVSINDAGLRVTSGVAGSVGGSAFSTVFAQTAVGNTTISLAQAPAHIHAIAPQAIIGGTTGGGGVGGGGTFGLQGAQLTDSQGGGAAHTHSVNLTLAYVDVIIASKS